MEDDSNSYSGPFGDGGGPPEVHTPRQYELADALRALRTVDPERAARILGERPDIRSVGDAMKKRKLGDNDEDARHEGDVSWGEYFTAPFAIAVPGEATLQGRRMGEWVKALRGADEFMAALEEKPSRAGEIADSLPLPELRAVALAVIARHQARRSRPEAEATLARAESMLAKVEEAGYRFNALVAMAHAWNALGERKRAWDNMEQALACVREFHRLDTHADNPNTAPREYWPSTQGIRTVMWNAGRMWKADADALLASFAIADLALLGRVELARALLDKPTTATGIRVSHSDTT